MPPKRPRKQHINRKNNLDLNVLVSQVSSMTTNELNNLNVASGCTNDAKRRASTETELEKLRKERDYFESQLKFQAQVNSELKNLLVAAVGEDLQTRVNVLTEDKLQLARALLNSAHNLSSHTEQIEYLAGQSEVWRSKFLASSLMVEELARWKASLMQKNKLLLESNKQMLETFSQLRDMQIHILRNLKFLAQVKTLNLPTGNALDIASECLNISENLVLHSGIGMPANIELGGLDATTNAEKLAVEAIQNSNQTLKSTDEAFKAIVDQAFPMTKVTTETQTDAN